MEAIFNSSKNMREKVKKTEVEVEGARNKAISYQCGCEHVEFEKESAANHL